VEIINQKQVDRLAAEIGKENVPVLLEIFLNELAGYESTLLSLEGQEQHAYLTEVSHALKSSAASFGADALCNYSILLDKNAKLGEQLSSPSCKKEMLDLLKKTYSIYQNLFSQ
tara:strand:- start:361 stop:702 length:342 start_codon:yes stop_codon:yes gene_type:complete